MERPHRYNLLMTLKQNSKQILDVIAGQTKRNATKAYKEVHPTASTVTAATNAYKLLAKPEAQIYLEQHITKARNKVVELIDSPKENIALMASQDVLDRERGKARQVTEVRSTSLALTIDLTGDDIQPVLTP